MGSRGGGVGTGTGGSGRTSRNRAGARRVRREGFVVDLGEIGVVSAMLGGSGLAAASSKYPPGICMSGSLKDCSGTVGAGTPSCPFSTYQ